MTTPDLTPTPPADTRQPKDPRLAQAVQDARAAKRKAEAAMAATPPADTRQQAAEGLLDHTRGTGKCSCGQGPFSRHEYAAHVMTELDQAGLLASSSPALPEPPTPTAEGDGSLVWDAGVDGDPLYVDTLDGTVSIVGLLNIDPAGARLLASTLLAAADVAEEQP